MARTICLHHTSINSGSVAIITSLCIGMDNNIFWNAALSGKIVPPIKASKSSAHQWPYTDIEDEAMSRKVVPPSKALPKMTE